MTNLKEYFLKYHFERLKYELQNNKYKMRKLEENGCKLLKQGI